MLWIKALHIIAMVTWFAGLFYLPRLFVYHAMSEDQVSIARFKTMEQRLYYGIMTPGAIATILLGLGLLSFNVDVYCHATWLQLKLICVMGLLVFHLFCGYLRKNLALNPKAHSDRYYRWINEIPTFFLVVIVILVVVKPNF